LDVAQVVLYAFWIFFAGLIFYLRREDKREGYPLESDRTARTSRMQVVGFPTPPAPKTFLRPNGGTYSAPPGAPDTREIRATPVAPWPGAPLTPTGNPMLDGVGPAAYANREDKPELTYEGEPLIAPLRLLSECSIDPRDADPRGMRVVGADLKVAGTVTEVWVDRAEPQIRYLEVEVAGGKHVLVPMTMALVNGAQRTVEVSSILAHQFADVPGLSNPDVVTKLEEDKITAYFAGGLLYATPDRLGPLL
jgi:photosynthetic reaction center H subunit